jgi:ubiquinone/menaquinone biosynthesis C-methylase UbiE
MTVLRQQKLVRLYENLFADPCFSAFFNDSGYANYGLWDAATHDGEQACDNLLERLLSFLPRAGGTVLDVGCGQGGTTRRLARQFGAEAVTAINVCDKQLATAQQRAPGCRFLRMDAVDLQFDDASFDVVVCVEAAFHFETRQEFLRQAHRVLMPGGCLLLADIVARVGAGRIPRANLVRSVGEYEAVMRDAGFSNLVIEDVRERSWKTFRRKYLSFVARGASSGRSWRVLPRLPWAAWRFLVTDFAIRNYLLVCARRE